MRKSLSVILAGALLGLVIGVSWWQRTRRELPPPEFPPAAGARSVPEPGRTVAAGGAALPPSPAAPDRRIPAGASPHEAEVQKIQRDYEEMVTKVAAEFGAAGASFPGGLKAYLRQLALLEREKWQDMAAILPPRELEDLKMKETRAGKEVQRWLSDVGATDEQRRAVFRLQQAFDDQYALTFDFTSAVLARREKQRQDVQEAVLRELGPEKFGAWLRGEGPDYGNFAAFVEQQTLPPQTALELWRIKNEFVRTRLEIAAVPTQGPGDVKFQQELAARAALAKIITLLGPSAQVAMTGDLLKWLPYK
jgi:hypothetical protein